MKIKYVYKYSDFYYFYSPSLLVIENLGNDFIFQLYNFHIFDQIFVSKTKAARDYSSTHAA